METAPILRTERLILRSFTLSDAPEVQRLASDPDVALMTARVPHPYEDGMAEAWISGNAAKFEEGAGLYFAITSRTEQTAQALPLIGTISLEIDHAEKTAELGYWLGKPYWNRGYCTEAATAVVRYGFEVKKLTYIHACYLERNPASGRVLQKIGMQYEAHCPKAIKRGDVPEDVIQYGMQRSAFDKVIDIIPF